MFIPSCAIKKTGKNVSISHVLVSTSCRTHVAYAILIIVRKSGNEYSSNKWRSYNKSRV